MFNSFPESWHKVLRTEMEQDYFHELEQQVKLAYETSVCFPPIELIFQAFQYCDLDALKVVIIGQDPYHGEGEANGLAFSVSDGIKIPPSLRNIYREIASDLDLIMHPSSGNLVHWAKQGVLLLNATLTVEKDKPNSHKHLQWNRFTNAIIEKISDEKKDVVFLLWGNFAQKKGSKIDRTKHLVLESGHPSPMSANQGKWFGNKHFSQTNNYLIERGLNAIDWF